MGIMDTGVEALALTKAIVEVIDTTKANSASKDIIGCVGRLNDHSAKKAQFKAAKAKYAMKEEASKIKRAAAAVAGIDLGADETLNLFNEKMKAIDSKATIRRFEVQFNPSSLSLSGNGGGLSQLTNYTAKKAEERGVSYGKASEHIEMTVQLVFDNTNNMVAFPGDMLGINISSAANTAITAGINKLKGHEVQTEVEGFLGALRSEFTRGVAFCWGRMLYFGYVNRVSSKYTLFNPSGKPVRATVDMTIVCADASVTPGNLGYWQQKYDDFFKADMSLSGNRNGIVNLSNFSR